MKGTFFSVNQTTDFKGYKDIVDTLFGSFSFPGFFSPTQAFSSHYIEGSSVRSLDVISAINYCLNQGFAEQDIVIDTILASPADLERVDANDYRSYMMLYRYLQISNYYSAMNGLQRAKFTNPNVTYRYVISPTVYLPSSFIPMSLNATDINTIYDQGVQDGQQAIQKGVSIDDHLEYYQLKKSGKKSVKNFTEFLEVKKGLKK